MDWYNKVKDFLGFHSPPPTSFGQNPNRSFNRPNFTEEESPDPNNFHQQRRSFNVFTNPFEMHKYFEQQMDDMLKGFVFGNFFGGPFSNWVAVEDHPEGATSPTDDLRSQYLKPGYENRSSQQEKKDRDVDGQLNMSELDSIFGNQEHSIPSTSAPHHKVQTFRQNILSSTVLHSNGTVEVRNSVRDGQGNEEIRVTYKTGDKEYTVITKRDPTGKEEITENFINLEKSEVSKYFPPSATSPPVIEGPINQWLPFNEFLSGINNDCRDSFKCNM